MDSSCRLPWKWLVVDLAANKWRWCCKVDWQADFINGYGFDNLPLLKTRKAFIDGQRPSACGVCWREEDAGGTSYRTGVIGATTRDQLPPSQGLEFIDIIYGNLCNLRCASCGPSSSSQWSSLLNRHTGPEEPWLLPQPRMLPTDIAVGKLLGIINDNANQLTHINLYGGEPSVDPNAVDLMFHLSRMDLSKRSTTKPPLEIRVYTNGQWKQDGQGDSWIEVLRGLESAGWRVRIKFSIDAVGDHAHFVRIPTDWELMRSNINHVFSMGMVDDMHVTTSMINIPVLHEIPIWAASEPWGDMIKPVVNLVNRPPIMSLANLGPHLKEFTAGWDQVPDLPNWRHFVGWIRGMADRQHDIGHANQAMIRRFLAYINWYARANQTTISPLLAKAYDRYSEIAQD